MQRKDEELLKELVAQNNLKSLQAVDINDDTDLLEELALDSIAIVNLFADIEEEFQVKINISEIKTPILSKFHYLKEYVESLMEGRS